jgi:uncharacterized membrane protein
MEFILLILVLIFGITLLNRTTGLRLQLERLNHTLRALAERLEGERPVPAGAPAAAAEAAMEAAAAPMQRSATPDIIRDTRVDEPPAPPVAPAVAAPPPPPEPAMVVPEAVVTEPPVPEAQPSPVYRTEVPPEEPADDRTSGEVPPPPQPRADFSDLEKRFGTQWVVWVGGVALALGGVLLVRYSIEQGLFTPGLRVTAAAILALVLVGLGELARRRENASDIAQMPRAHIPSILTAAGTTIAYADVYAAYVLYEFLSAGSAFLLLGLVALATLGAALLHGPALGGLGLIGAYVTPMLVTAAQPNYWALYIYLAVVTAAAYALARFRSWQWLTFTAAVFSILWMFVGLGDPSAAARSAHAFYALAGFALAAVFLVPGLLYGTGAKSGQVHAVSSGVLAGYLLGACFLVFATNHDHLSMVTFFVLCVGAVIVASRSEATIAAMAFAAGLAVLIVVHWAVNFDMQILFSPTRGPFWGAPPTWTIVGRNQHLAFALGIAALFAGAGYLNQGRSNQPRFSMLWAACAVLTPIIILIAFYYSLASYGRSIPFALTALGLAAAFAAATYLLSKRDPARGVAEGCAIFATGAVAALALGLTFALERGWLTVALALMVPGIAWISHRQPVPMLRALCGVIILLVMARIAIDPSIVGGDVGRTPIFNWLLWGYGVPMVAFWLAARILRMRADDVPARMAESAAILFTALTAMLEVRHLMNDGDIFRPKPGLGEIGLQISIWLAMTIGLERQRERSGSIIHDVAATIFAVLSFAGILFGLLMTENPLFTGSPVGGAFLNYVLLGYGFPAVLMGILTRVIRNTRPQPYYILAAVTAILLALAYLTLQVRTLFHGPVLNARFILDAEHYTYSAVWLAFGVALLLVGIVLKSQPARFASAAVIILDTFKVFLVDLWGVQGLWRALSIICLGLVLIGIGWLYQRLLFPSRKREPPAAPAPA